MRCTNCTRYNTNSPPSCSMWRRFINFWMGEDVMKPWLEMTIQFDDYVTQHLKECEKYVEDYESPCKVLISKYFVPKTVLVRYLRVHKALQHHSFMTELDRSRRRIHEELLTEAGLKRDTLEGRDFSIQIDIWIHENQTVEEYL